MWKDLKYFIAYIAPVATLFGIYCQDIWTFAGFFVAFVAIPIVEAFLKPSDKNFSTAEEEDRTKSPFFDWLLYLNIPFLWFIIGYYFFTLSNFQLAPYEIVGLTMSVGVMVGAIGINVAHELGHRSNAFEQTLSKIQLLPALYMHFFIEHNRGHHRYVSTPEDPSSARYGGSPIFLLVPLSIWRLPACLETGK